MELERYDRQIRAWGFKTQERLRACRFLVYGITSASLECMKNLILAGASLIHVVDVHHTANAFAGYVEFLKGLNPHCPLLLADEGADINAYDFICLFGACDETLLKMVRSQKVCLCSDGLSAYLFSNVSDYDFVFDKQLNKGAVIDETVTGSLISQLIVDHLPPVNGTLLLSMKFDPCNFASSVKQLM